MPVLDYEVIILLTFAVMIFSLIIQFALKATFKKYSKVASETGITAEQAAKAILREAGVAGITFGRVRGELTDYYDPSHGTICLSDSVSGSSSIAAIAVAAHECGHAIQNDKGVLIYRIRHALAPVASISSRVGGYLATAGILLSYYFDSSSSSLSYYALTGGIFLYFISVLFYLVMVPVEYDASNRALRIIKELGLVGDNQTRGCKKVLRAAGRTYVIALASVALTLLRLVSIRGRRSRR